MTKKEVKDFFTAIHYEAADNGQTEQLQSMERELETTTDIKHFIKKYALTKPLKDFYAERGN